MFHACRYAHTHKYFFSFATLSIASYLNASAPSTRGKKQHVLRSCFCVSCTLVVAKGGGQTPKYMALLVQESAFNAVFSGM